MTDDDDVETPDWQAYIGYCSGVVTQVVGNVQTMLAAWTGRSETEDVPDSASPVDVLDDDWEVFLSRTQRARHGDDECVNAGGLTPLHLAAGVGKWNVCQSLLADCESDSDRAELLGARTALGFTPLLVALERDHEDVVAGLIRAGADLHAKTSNGQGARQLAGRKTQWMIVKALADGSGALTAPGDAAAGKWWADGELEAKLAAREAADAEVARLRRQQAAMEARLAEEARLRERSEHMMRVSAREREVKDSEEAAMRERLDLAEREREARERDLAEMRSKLLVVTDGYDVDQYIRMRRERSRQIEEQIAAECSVCMHEDGTHADYCTAT